MKCGKETQESVWEGQSPLLLRRPLQKVLAASLLKEEYKALYCLEVSAHWVPKLLGSDQKWIQHNLSGENDSLASSGNL